MTMRSTLTSAATVLLAVSAVDVLGQGAGAEATGHCFDMTIDPAAIAETQRLGPRSFPP